MPWCPRFLHFRLHVPTPAMDIPSSLARVMPIGAFIFSAASSSVCFHFIRQHLCHQVGTSSLLSWYPNSFALQVFNTNHGVFESASGMVGFLLPWTTSLTLHLPNYRVIFFLNKWLRTFRFSWFTISNQAMTLKNSVRSCYCFPTNQSGAKNTRLKI